mmetsp:Transcript_47312/g.112520  ORF Transcript_47312/g.112520 Transcript_47312/m.112520 type:complete len:267 (+) Transcript_47312:1534-2334(+)
MDPEPAGGAEAPNKLPDEAPAVELGGWPKRVEGAAPPNKLEPPELAPPPNDMEEDAPVDPASMLNKPPVEPLLGAENKPPEVLAAGEPNRLEDEAPAEGAGAAGASELNKPPEVDAGDANKLGAVEPAEPLPQPPNKLEPDPEAAANDEKRPAELVALVRRLEPLPPPPKRLAPPPKRLEPLLLPEAAGAEGAKMLEADAPPGAGAGFEDVEGALGATASSIGRLALLNASSNCAAISALASFTANFSCTCSSSDQSKADQIRNLS